LLGWRKGAFIFSRMLSATFHLRWSEALAIAFLVADIFDPWD